MVPYPWSSPPASFEHSSSQRWESRWECHSPLISLFPGLSPAQPRKTGGLWWESTLLTGGSPVQAEGNYTTGSTAPPTVRSDPWHLALHQSNHDWTGNCHSPVFFHARQSHVPAPVSSGYVCGVCGCVCRSRIGLDSHNRKCSLHTRWVMDRVQRLPTNF